MARPGGTARPLESAARHVEGDARPIPTHDEPTEQRSRRAAVEESALRAWAFEHYDDPRATRLPNGYIGRGAEHEVYGDPKRRRVIKITRKSEAANYGFGISLNHDGRGATAGEYLDRLCLHNLLFNDDVRLEGVWPTVGSTKVITSQPFIIGDKAPAEEIDAYMDAKGFERLTEATYYHHESSVLVHDLYPRNAVFTPEGAVRAIDPAILRATSEFAQFIRRTG